MGKGIWAAARYSFQEGGEEEEREGEEKEGEKGGGDDQPTSILRDASSTT